MIEVTINELDLINGGGNDDSIYVYAYLKTSTTLER